MEDNTACDERFPTTIPIFLLGSGDRIISTLIAC